MLWNFSKQFFFVFKSISLPITCLIRFLNRIWSWLLFHLYIFTFIWYICSNFWFLFVQVISSRYNTEIAWISRLLIDNLMNFHGNLVTLYLFWVTFFFIYIYIFEIQFITRNFVIIWNTKMKRLNQLLFYFEYKYQYIPSNGCISWLNSNILFVQPVLKAYCKGKILIFKIMIN